MYRMNSIIECMNYFQDCNVAFVISRSSLDFMLRTYDPTRGHTVHDNFGFTFAKFH